MRLPALLLMLSASAACAQSPDGVVSHVVPPSEQADPNAPLPDMTPPACDHAAWIGRPLARKGQEANAPANAILERDLKEPYRILLPDSMMTEDYSPARINVMIAPDGIIRDVTCG